jgi:hypothetical protein
MVNWERAKKVHQRIIDKDGVWILVLDRITSGSDAYDTGSLIGYGYGDVTTYWTTGSMKVIIKQLQTVDVELDIGFSLEDYQEIYFNPDLNINQWNIVIYPTGSDGSKFLVLPTQTYRFEESGIAVTKHVRIRRLFPRSGSSN